MSNKQCQQPLELEIPEKVAKKKKGYYIPVWIINFIKDESDRLGVSENDIFTAIVRCYQKTSVITTEGGPAYEQHDK